MIAGSCTHDEAGELLERCISAYNAGVRTRDFAAFLALLTDDAVLDFEGIPDRGPFRGKAAIAGHFENDPPDDPVRVKRWKFDGSKIVAEFTWIGIPEGHACLLMTPRGRQIAHVIVALGGPHCSFH